MSENCSNLSGFCDRMKERAFPDWDEMCTNLDMNSHLPKPPPKEEEPAAAAEEKGKEEKEEKEKDDSEKKEEDDKDNKTETKK